MRYCNLANGLYRKQKSFLCHSMVLRQHQECLLLLTLLELYIGIIHSHVFVSPPQAWTNRSCVICTCLSGSHEAEASGPSCLHFLSSCVMEIPSWTDRTPAVWLLGWGKALFWHSKESSTVPTLERPYRCLIWVCHQGYLPVSKVNADPPFTAIALTDPRARIGWSDT